MQEEADTNRSKAELELVSLGMTSRQTKQALERRIGALEAQLAVYNSEMEEKQLALINERRHRKLELDMSTRAQR
jgi:hypothetical protein